MKWRVVKLDEIKAPEKGALVSGPFGSNIGSRFFVSEGVPVIRGNNLSMGQKKFIDDGFVFITEDKARELKNCNARSGDIIFTAAGTLGQVGLMPKLSRFQNYIISNKQIRLRLDTNQAFPPFAYYFLSSPSMRAFIASQNKGSSVPLLTLGIIRNLKIPLPPITIQKRVAAILSAYDELIENNQRRIALLEKMAEEIYREWFVRQRFPGHEKVKVIKGVPDGWEIKKLGEILELCYGKALKDDDRVPGEFHVYGSSGVVGTHNEALVKTPGLIVGRKGNVGSVYWSERGFFPIDTVYFVKSELPNSFLYFLLRSMNFINNDAAVPGLNRSQAYSNLFFLPPVQLIKKYEEVADTQFEMKRFLTRQNEYLTLMRDRLLPRLISGKLSVENLDIQFPPGMEEAAHEA